MSRSTKKGPFIEPRLLDKIRDMDAVVLAVSHSDYAQNGWPLVSACLRDGKGIVFDVRTCLDRARQPEGVELLRL